MTSRTKSSRITIAEDELLALHKSLLEAKFHALPDNSDIAGSPLVAAIANRVFDALVRLEESRGNVSKAREWADWRRAADKKWIVGRVRDYAMQNPHWRKWDGAERLDYLRCALSPFQMGDADLHALMNEINAATTP